MSAIQNAFSTIRYRLSKKSEPVFDDYAKIITDFSELTPLTSDPYDLSGGIEHYEFAPTPDGIFLCQKMTQQESDQCYSNFVKYCNDMGITVPSIREKWRYKSTACNSYNKFRINIYKPGRIVVKCTLPEYGCASPWMYLSMNKGDFGNPYILPIDRPLEPRDFYFEIDMFETFHERKHQRLGFSGHYGTQSDRKMKTTSITGKFNDYHFSEVRWDGKGNWTWLLDSVVIHKKFIPQPENINPYFLFTLIIWAGDNIPASLDTIYWKVDYIKFSDNLITEGLVL